MRSQVKKLSVELKYANERITRLVSEVAELAEAAKNETAFAGIARIISPSAIEDADDTRVKMGSAEGAAAAVAAAAGEKSDQKLDVSEARIAQMARQLERLLYGGGAGNLERTRVLWAAVVERPAIQRLLSLTAPSEAKMAAAAKASMAHAKQAPHALALALCSIAHEAPILLTHTSLMYYRCSPRSRLGARAPRLTTSLLRPSSPLFFPTTPRRTASCARSRHCSVSTGILSTVLSWSTRRPTLMSWGASQPLWLRLALANGAGISGARAVVSAWSARPRFELTDTESN